VNDELNIYSLASEGKPLHHDKESAVFSWLNENVAKPALNSMACQPYNALANGINSVTAPFLGPVVPKLTPFELEPASPLSPEWWVQTASAGLGASLPYILCGTLAKHGLGRSRYLMGLTPGSTMDKIWSHRATGPIVGALALDATRDLHPGESRMGACSGALAFSSVMEFGNLRNSSLTARVPSTFVIGGSASVAQRLVSDLITNGTAPRTADLQTSFLAGGMFNLALSGLHSRTTSLSETTREARTRPYTERRIALLNDPSDPIPRFHDRIPLAAGTARLTSVLIEAPSTKIENNGARPKAEPFAILPVKGNIYMLCEPHGSGPWESYEQYQNQMSAVRKEFTMIEWPGLPTKVGYSSSRTDVHSDLTSVLSELRTQLRDLPDPRVIRRLFISNIPHADQKWVRISSGDPKAEIGAEAFPNGDVVLFDHSIPDMASRLRHEFAHLIKLDSPNASRLFDDLGIIQPTKLHGRTYEASAVNEEAWAILLGEGLMHDRPWIRQATASMNPMRSVVAADALKQRMATVPSTLQSTRHTQYSDIADWVLREVKPVALETARISFHNESFYPASLMFLKQYGGVPEIKFLMDAKKTSSKPVGEISDTIRSIMARMKSKQD
jgi:hypothetical protein